MKRTKTGRRPAARPGKRSAQRAEGGKRSAQRAERERRAIAAARRRRAAKERRPGRADLPHLDEKGAARMVDVGEKRATRRAAIAEAFVRLSKDTLSRLERAEIEKGDALAVARLGGITAAKRTSELVLLAHPLALSKVEVELELEPLGVRIEARVECTGPTGVEMEALTAASAAALNLYDMVKKHERGAVIERVRLLYKSGGRSGTFERQRAASTT